MRQTRADIVGKDRLEALNARLAGESDGVERALLLLERATLLDGGARIQDAVEAYQTAPSLSQPPLALLQILADRRAHKGIEKVLRAELQLEVEPERVQRGYRLLIAAVLARALPSSELAEAERAIAHLSEGPAKAALKERIARARKDHTQLINALEERERLCSDRKRAALFRLERLGMLPPCSERSLEMAKACNQLGESLHAALHYLSAAADPSLDPEVREMALLHASRAAPQSPFVQSFALAELTQPSSRTEVDTRLKGLDAGDPVDQLSEGFALLQAGRIKRATILLQRAYERAPTTEALLLLDRALELRGAHRERAARLEAHLGSDRAGELDPALRSSLLMHLSSVLEDELDDASGARKKLAEAALSEAPYLPALARLLIRMEAESPPDAETRRILLRRLIDAHPEDELTVAVLAEEALAGRLDASTLLESARSDLLVELARLLSLKKGDIDGAIEALIRLASASPELAIPARVNAAALSLALGKEDRARSIFEALPPCAPLTPLGIALAESLDVGRAKRQSQQTEAPQAREDDPLRAALEAELRGERDIALERYLRAFELNRQSPIALGGLLRSAFTSRPDLGKRALREIAASGAPGERSARLELALMDDEDAEAALVPTDALHALEIALGGRGDPQKSDAALLTLTDLAPDRNLALPTPLFEGAKSFRSVLDDPDLSDDERARLRILSSILDGHADDDLHLDRFLAREASELDRALARELTLRSPQAKRRAHMLLELALSPRAKVDVELLALSGWEALEAQDAEGALSAARRLIVLEPDDLSSLELLRVASIRAGEFALASTASLSLARFARGRRAHLLLTEAVELYLLSEDSPEGASELFEECAERGAFTPDTFRALSRRAEALDPEGQRERLSRLLSGLPEAHPLYKVAALELAFVEREHGNVRESRRWLERLGSSEALPVEALELSAELAIIENRRDEAIALLQRAIQRQSDPSKNGEALSWLAKLLGERGDVTKALLAYEELRALRPLLPEELESLSHLALRAGDHERAAAANLEAAATVGSREAAALHVRAASLASQLQGGSEIAKRFYRNAIREEPTNIDAVIGLHHLSVNPAEQRRIAERISELIDANFPLKRLDVAFVRSVANYARVVADPIRAAAVTEALSAIGFVRSESFDESDEYTQFVLHQELEPSAVIRALAVAPHHEPRRQAVEGGTEENALDHALSVFAHIDAALERGSRAERLGFNQSDRIRRDSRSALRDELNAIARLFGEEGLDLYRGGTDEGALFFGPFKKTRAFFAGASVKPPLSRAVRFSIGAELYSHRRGSASLLGLELEELAMFAEDLHRIARGEQAASRAIKGVSLGFLERRAFKAALERTGSVADLERVLRILRLEHDRASLLAVGDLHETLRLVIGGAPEPAKVEGNERGLALFSFFIDRRAAAFHRLYGAGQWVESHE